MTAKQPEENLEEENGKEMQKAKTLQHSEVIQTLIGFLDAYANRQATTPASPHHYEMIVQHYTNVLCILPVRASLRWIAFFALTKSERRFDKIY